MALRAQLLYCCTIRTAAANTLPRPITRLKTLGIECSMSRTGNRYDKAAMERFFWSLKHEWTNHQQFQHLEDARLNVIKYLETFFNPVRLHQALSYQPPVQHEADHAPAVAA